MFRKGHRRFHFCREPDLLAQVAPAESILLGRDADPFFLAAERSSEGAARQVGPIILMRQVCGDNVLQS